MDLQWALNTVIGVLLALGGFLLNGFRADMKDLRSKQEELPHLYARRDDMKDLSVIIINRLQRIEDKLDEKADRQH